MGQQGALIEPIKQRGRTSHFSWLPDAETDPHPRLTWLAECAFDLGVSLFYLKEEIRPSGYRLEPGTLLLSNHQRDCDIPILTTAICERQGLQIRWPLPFYATREDIFSKHFLGNLLVSAGWPKLLAQAIGQIQLGWLFKTVRAKPMRRIREFTFNEALRLATAECRSVHPNNILNARGLRLVEGQLGVLPNTLEPIQERTLGAAGLAFWGLRHLRLTTIKSIEKTFKAEINRQLDEFARLLDQGHVVYIAPEGTISGDGYLRRFRAGPWRVLQRCERPPRLQPLALGYDALKPGRLRVVIHIGDPLIQPLPGTRADFNALLRSTFLKLHALTPSHLIARYLSCGPRCFTERELISWIEQAVAAAKKSPIAVDPLFSRREFHQVLQHRIRWLHQRQLLEHRGWYWSRVGEFTRSPGWHCPEAIASYLNNSLSEIVASEPTLKEVFQP